MTDKNLTIITKIILIYSIFYVGLKLFSLFQGAWLIPNLLVAVPFIVLAFISGLMVKEDKYSWPFVILGAAVIILIRVFETQLVFWIQEQL